MALSWARQHFQNAKDQFPVNSPEWHLAEGLRQLADSLESRLREVEQNSRCRS